MRPQTLNPFIKVLEFFTPPPGFPIISSLFPIRSIKGIIIGNAFARELLAVDEKDNREMALPTKQTTPSNPSILLPSELVDKCVNEKVWIIMKERTQSSPAC